jgi:hypothetical protein
VLFFEIVFLLQRQTLYDTTSLEDMGAIQYEKGNIGSLQAKVLRVINPLNRFPLLHLCRRSLNKPK